MEWWTFLAPQRLWALVIVLALAAGYAFMQQRRAQYAARLASASMLDSVLPNRPGATRHIPPILLLMAMVVLVGAFARPARETTLPQERATVVVAIDVSLSMDANDVDPNRLTAAQAAAHRFVDELPRTINVGIVSFAGTATVRLPPTQDRALAHAAIDRLELAPSTAVGEAIFASLDALLLAPTDDSGEPPPASIVILSDGETTAGRAESSGVEAAIVAGVPVSTISFGTPNGVILYDDPETEFMEQIPVEVGVAEDNLRAIADGTGGTFFTASTSDELDQIWSEIGTDIGTKVEFRDIADLFSGVALALAALASGLSLWWNQRLT